MSASAPERDGYHYPLFRRNDRTLDPGYHGPLYVWDIDNTYLLTDYERLRDLIRIRFEAAEDKHPVPGAVELLTAIRRGDGGERPPVYFVSASPEAMRKVLERRMLLDGVVHDGITFRDFHALRHLRDIFGFKVVALLLYRLENPPRAAEILFGDDREHDPLVYTLYAKVCGGELRGDDLELRLIEHGVKRVAAKYAAALASELPEHDPVELMLIRRIGAAKDGELASDPRLVYVDDYTQAAKRLLAAGRIADEGFAAVVGAVRRAADGGER